MLVSKGVRNVLAAHVYKSDSDNNAVLRGVV